MSATTFLTSDEIDRLVTIEIEPLMVEASVVFGPANDAAFSDPRSIYVFDDAKSYFSYRQERFDIIFAEPSNPWVSGTAGLFTREFYDRVRTFLAEGGVLAQWLQMYELDDDLFLSVLAALDAAFPSYRAYLVGDSDVAIVARADGPLREPDWSVLGSERFAALTAGIPPFRPQHMRSLFLFDETTFRPILEQGVRANSDYRPVLDVGAERARFERRSADGAYSFANSRIPLQWLLLGATVDPAPYRAVPSIGLAAAARTERAAWLRGVYEAGGGMAPDHHPDWQNELLHLQTFSRVSAGDEAVLSWETWAAAFDRAETDLHFGTVGWADTTFYRAAYGYLARVEAPVEARAAVDLRHALALQDWGRVAEASDLLVSRVAAGEAWVPRRTLLDAAVLAYLHVDRPDAARTALDLLLPRTARTPWNLRNRLLEAMVAEEERRNAGR